MTIIQDQILSGERPLYGSNDWLNLIDMSSTDYLHNAQAWLDQQSQRSIDYQREIQHHNQMHKAYETSL